MTHLRTVFLAGNVTSVPQVCSPQPRQCSNSVVPPPAIGLYWARHSAWLFLNCVWPSSSIRPTCISAAPLKRTSPLAALFVPSCYWRQTSPSVLVISAPNGPRWTCSLNSAQCLPASSLLWGPDVTAIWIITELYTKPNHMSATLLLPNYNKM